MDVLGYSDPLSVRPGETINFMVSCTRDTFRAAVVRLVHGDEGPQGPGFIEEELGTTADRDYQGRVQVIHPGSAVTVPDAELLRPQVLVLDAYLLPTTALGGRQAVLTKWSESSQQGYGIFVDEVGRPEFVVATEHGVVTVSADRPVVDRRWYRVTARYDAETGRASITSVAQERAGRDAANPDSADVTGPAAPIVHSGGPFLMAGAWSGAGTGPGSVTAHFNGKISAPSLRGPDDAVIATWDLAAGPGSSLVADPSGNDLHGRAVNMPTRGVTGHAWNGASDHFERAPGAYDAIHFHDDDIEDAGWAPDVTWTVPSGLHSGIYALRLRTDVEGRVAEDHVPFFVLPRPGVTEGIAFLAPTNCYYAYTNERLEDNLGLPAHPDYVDDVGRYEYIVANRLRSIYDHHADGSGVCHATRLLPNLTMRPRHRMRMNNIPRLLTADLHVTEWLEHEGHAYDVLTDEALHHEGAALLSPYRVVITGTHPEYWSEQMLDALVTYLEGGGRCMYLGGNGFYWVTAFDPERPHVIEVRRPPGTTRAWECWPGEHHLSSTGEPGGLWRHRGRAPQTVVGVGFAAQGFDANAPYCVNKDLAEEGVFALDGVAPADGRIADDDSLVLSRGAAGFEVDRVDHALGTPTGTHVIASTRPGDFSDSYQAVVEDTMVSDSMQGGSVNPDVRSDMVVVPYPNGGAVFSVGSISWSGSLSAAGYQSDVSKITRNVLNAFLERATIG